MSDDVEAIGRATLRGELAELRRDLGGLELRTRDDLKRIEDRVFRLESRTGDLSQDVGLLAGREHEREDRSQRTERIKAAKYNRWLAAKIIGAAVTVALAIVGAAKC